MMMNELQNMDVNNIVINRLLEFGRSIEHEFMNDD